MEAPAPPPYDVAPDVGPGSLGHVVSALIDQLAAGQVETLYGLHTAAAGVRQQTEALREAVTTPVEALTAAARAVRVAHVELASATTALEKERLALQSLAADLTAQVTAMVVSQVQAQLAQLADTQVELTVSRIAAATEALTASSERGLQALDHTSAAVVEQVAAGVEQIRQASAETVAGIDSASRILVDAFANRVESFFAQLRQDLTRREVRDASREKALTARVQLLVDHSEEMLESLTGRLSEQTDRLVRRDQEQELARAEAFVAVLETLLTKLGGRRQLRTRVREAVHAEHLVPDPTLTAPAVPAVPAAAAVPSAPRKRTTPAPKKAPTRKKDER